jgi:hypothetical protein
MSMIAFQLVGLALVVLFLGALISGGSEHMARR